MSKKQQADKEEASESMEEAGSDNPKIAFFITPVAQPNSDIRRATDGVIDAVLKPVLERHGFELIAPHRVSVPGSITKQVIRDILRADLVIANLTGLNANVMYELAVRHAKRLPVITIAQKGTDLPFDIAAERTLFYTNDMNGVIELTNELEQFIPQAMNLTNPDNPIYSGLESLLIQQESIKENDPVQSYILKQLEDINGAVRLLQSGTVERKNSSASSQNKTTMVNRYLVYTDNSDNTANSLMYQINSLLESQFGNNLLVKPRIRTEDEKAIVIFGLTGSSVSEEFVKVIMQKIGLAVLSVVHNVVAYSHSD